ncbi:MAG: PEGA domain-containing protein [Labilithrix sp.]|nr:PEGA domain-containing protein [Labilithrix sp.]
MRLFFVFLRGFALSALLLAAFAGSASAEGPPKISKSDRAEAARLKKEADTLMDQDRHVDALALYARAYELTADPALLYNQGRALESMGDYPDAIDKLERFDREASPALRAKVPGLHDLLVDLRGRVATLVVTTNAPGARLLVRDKAAGTIQKETRIRTRAGAATIEVVAEGYVPFKKEIELAGGSTVVVDAQLSLKKRDALILVRTRPSADISVDDKPIGRSPLELRVPPGEHTLVAEAAGRETERVRMTLALGDRREVDIELRESAGVLSRWWFWTSVGVVVAGGAVAAYALTQERAPDRGTFGAGVLPGP